MGPFAKHARQVKAAIKRHLYDALDERGLIPGMRVEFPAPGRSVLRTFEESGPGPGQILVETLATVISPGTERAIYRQLETIAVEFPFAPGYCQAGRVVMAGSESRFHLGELVATPGAHASFVLSTEAAAFHVPPGVTPEQAAFTELGFTALQGVRRGGIEPGARVVVLGAGLVGLLAAQAARVAGGSVTVCATSSRRLGVAAELRFETLATREARRQLADLAGDVVIEATGNPEALQDACLAASAGATVVLLGSPRGVTRAFDPASSRAKRLSLIGAHVAAVPQVDSCTEAWPRRREGELFLELVARRQLILEPLITQRASPDEAPQIYSKLAEPEDHSVAVVFDWTRPGPWRSRVQRPSLLRGVGRMTRRAAGRVVSATPASKPPRADGRRIRFGLVGCGEIAILSARALAAASNCEIAIVADPDVQSANRLAAGTGSRATANIGELFDSRDVDAVLISTPHHLHAPLAIQAAAAGKHVVVEKPMATRVSDCDRMIDAAARSGVTLSVCYCFRYDPRVQKAKELLDKGVIGRPIGTRIVLGQFRSKEYWSRGLSGRSVSDWRGRRETAGGGVLIMNACHILDYMGWLLGSDVTEVVACTATLTQDVEVEDSISMSYRYAQGALGTLDATSSQVGPDTFEQVIRGTEGQLVVAPSLRFWSRENVDGYERGRWHAVKGLAQSTERRKFFEEFADSVLDGTPPPVAASDARAVQAVIEAAYRSAEDKHAVRVDSL